MLRRSGLQGVNECKPICTKPTIRFTCALACQSPSRGRDFSFVQNIIHCVCFCAVETCLATEDDVLMASGPGGKHMALYEVCDMM